MFFSINDAKHFGSILAYQSNSISRKKHLVILKYNETTLQNTISMRGEVLSHLRMTIQLCHLLKEQPIANHWKDVGERTMHSSLDRSRLCSCVVVLYVVSSHLGCKITFTLQDGQTQKQHRNTGNINPTHRPPRHLTCHIYIHLSKPTKAKFSEDGSYVVHQTSLLSHQQLKQREWEQATSRSWE